MFPKHTFSTTRFLLIISCLSLSTFLFQIINKTDTNILLFSLSIILFSLAIWSVFVFLGIMDRVERVEKYAKNFQDGLAPIHSNIQWRSIPPESRNLEEKRAALNYYFRVFKRADAMSHIIFYASIGVYFANYSTPNNITLYFGLFGSLMTLIGVVFSLAFERRKKELHA